MFGSPWGKTCTKCHEMKSLDDFYRNKRGRYGRQSQCKTCCDVVHQQWVKNNPQKIAQHQATYNKTHSEKVKTKTSSWIKNNPESYKKRKNAWKAKNPDKVKSAALKSDYGINLNDFNLLLSQQNNSCAICTTHKDNLTKNLCVDHSHKTGKIRGLLCSKCNRALGLFGDNALTLRQAAAYLEKNDN